MTRARDAQSASGAALGASGMNCADAASYTRLNRLTGGSARKEAGAVAAVTPITSVAGVGEPHQAMQLFDHLPDGFIAFAVPDHSCDPLIRRGEIAIVDIHDRMPEAGSIYLRRIVSSDGRARICLHEIALLARNPGPDGEDRDRWVLVAHNRPKSVEDWSAWSAQFGPVPLADGLYDPSGNLRGYPWDSLVGRVAGILTDREARR